MNFWTIMYNQISNLILISFIRIWTLTIQILLCKTNIYIVLLKFPWQTYWQLKYWNLFRKIWSWSCRLMDLRSIRLLIYKMYSTLKVPMVLCISVKNLSFVYPRWSEFIICIFNVCLITIAYWKQILGKNVEFFIVIHRILSAIM